MQKRGDRSAQQDKRAMKRIFWSFIDTASMTGLSTIFLIVLGNILSSDHVGVFVAISLLLMFLSAFLSLRIDGAIIQKLNDSSLEKDGNHYFTAGWALVFLCGLLAILLFWIFRHPILSFFNLENDASLAYMAVPLVFLQIQIAYFGGVLNACFLFKQLAVTNLVFSLLKFTLAIVFLFLGWNLWGIFLALYISGVLQAVALLILCFRKFHLVFDSSLFPTSQNILKFSLLLLLGSIAIFLDRQIDLFFVNHYLDKDQVAVYNYAIKLPLLFLIIGNSVSRVTYPAMTNAFSRGNHQRIEWIFSNSLDWSFALISFASLLLVIHARYIINAILPDRYIVILPLLGILTCGIILRSTITSVGAMLSSRGMPHYSSLFNWAMVLINGGLNVILIPKYGLIGAAIATSASFGILPMILFAVARYKLNLSYHYIKLILNYLVVVAIVLCHSFVWKSMLLSEILFFVYLVYLIGFYLDRSQKQYVLEQFHFGVRKHSSRRN